jgi:molecular chaperone HtpG
MKSIDVELGKSNMLPLIASQQFYASWKVFIRELLLNAMDACNVRQALEWSWGTEFLEMEQASQMRDVRAIYEPRIDITYSSDTRLFTIEDNGIGINEYDLEHFIAQIGASYYTSTDFFNQQLKYEPYSHYGIGICSCFTVSKAVLIESKKDKVINTAWNISNPQDTAPVMAKWFGESGQIEYVISQKKTPGTRISIPVKPSYAPYIDLDFIVETIKHYMLTLPIPVNIRCDTREVCLSQPKAKWNYPMNELVGMNIIRVDNSLLEGYVAIYHPKHKGYFHKSTLYQQGVLVSDATDILGLAPSWIDNFSYQLNIKKRFLNISISRDGAAFDEKLIELRQYIGQIIIDAFGQSPLTLGQYLSDGRKRLVCEYEAENELVSRAVQVLVYIKEREVEVPVRTVINGFIGRKIKIAFMQRALFAHYRENYPYDYGQFIDKYDIIVFEQNIRAFWQFMTPYITSMEYVMGDMPGIIYTDVSADLTVAKTAASFRNDYVLRPEYYDLDPVFCLVSNELTDPMELVINTRNRNAMLLQRAEKYKKVRIARAVIIENIKQRILGNASRWNSIIDFGGELVHQYELEKPMSLQAQWCLERDFPDEINAYIAKTFTDREIADYGLTSLYFTRKDFIKWWMAP